MVPREQPFAPSQRGPYTPPTSPAKLRFATQVQAPRAFPRSRKGRKISRSSPKPCQPDMGADRSPASARAAGDHL